MTPLSSQLLLRDAKNDVLGIVSSLSRKRDQLTVNSFDVNSTTSSVPTQNHEYISSQTQNVEDNIAYAVAVNDNMLEIAMIVCFRMHHSQQS